MLDRRFSAAELAKLAGLPLPTLTFFLREGILEPSVQRASGRGRGHVFDVADLVAARTLNALRFQNASAGPLRRLVRFWHTTDGRDLIESLHDHRGKKKPRVLLVTDGGVEVDATPADVMERYNSAVVYCLDATKFIEDLNVAATEGLMRLEFQEPGRSGRVPPNRATAPRTARTLRQQEPVRGRSTKKPGESKKRRKS